MFRGAALKKLEKVAMITLIASGELEGGDDRSVCPFDGSKRLGLRRALNEGSCKSCSSGGSRHEEKQMSFAPSIRGL